MSDFYTESPRAMQDKHGASRLARTVQNAIIRDVVEGPNADFTESRDFFFLSTVDGHGRSTVSYKGGPVGVVHVAEPKTPVFPIRDGNGMFLSAGNAAETATITMDDYVVHPMEGRS